MKLLIADDHPIFRSGLKDILVHAYPNAIILECPNGQEALDTIRKEQPEISILDINMPLMDGLDVCRQVHKENLKTQIIILTMYREKEMIKKAMLSGASGYILKDFAVDELIECIAKVRSNEKYIGPALHPMYTDMLQLDKKKQELITLLEGLTQAELKTLKLVSQNKSTKEMAELLFLSEKTIENYRSKVCQKLGLPPRNNSLLLWISENRELLSSTSEF
ncbi:MAG: response regulator [Bacteroidia bacterium]